MPPSTTGTTTTVIWHFDVLTLRTLFSTDQPGRFVLVQHRRRPVLTPVPTSPGVRIGRRLLMLVMLMLMLMLLLLLVVKILLHLLLRGWSSAGARRTGSMTSRPGKALGPILAVIVIIIVVVAIIVPADRCRQSRERQVTRAVGRHIVEELGGRGQQLRGVPRLVISGPVRDKMIAVSLMMRVGVPDGTSSPDSCSCSLRWRDVETQPWFRTRVGWLVV